MSAMVRSALQSVGSPTECGWTRNTQANPTSAFLRRQRSLADAEADRPQRDGAVYVAPIIVNDRRLGTIRMSANGTSAAAAKWN